MLPVSPRALELTVARTCHRRREPCARVRARRRQAKARHDAARRSPTGRGRGCAADDARGRGGCHQRIRRDLRRPRRALVDGLRAAHERSQGAERHAALQIVSQALSICGIAGYKTDTKYSVERHLRDAYSAGIQINNDRVLGASASMLLVHREDA